MAEEQVATATIGVVLDAEKAWKRFQKATRQNAKQAEKTLDTAFGRMVARQTKRSQSGFAKALADMKQIRKTVPAVSSMFSTMQDQVRGVGQSSHNAFLLMVTGIKTVRSHGTALSLMFSTMQDQVHGLGREMGESFSGTGLKGIRQLAIAGVTAVPGKGVDGKVQRSQPGPKGLPSVKTIVPGIRKGISSVFSQFTSDMRGLGTTANSISSAFASTFANLERRMPQVEKLGDSMRSAVSSTRERGRAAIQRVRPFAVRGSALMRDTRDIAGLGANAIGRHASSAFSSARSSVGNALEPANKMIQEATGSAEKHFRAIMIQGKRAGRAIAKDFEPVTNVFGQIGGQIRASLLGPLKRSVGNAATILGQQLGKAFSPDNVTGFQRAVRAISGSVVSVGRRAVQTGIQVTTSFFGTAFRRSIGMAGKAMKGLGGAIGRVSRSVRRMMMAVKSTLLPLAALGAGLSVIGTGVLSVNTFASFEQSMSRVQALTNATTGEFGMLSRKAEELGATTMFSASQASQAMGNFAQAGFNVNEIMGAVGPTLDLAAAGQLDMATASDITAKVMRGMGLEVSELSHVTDVLTKAFTTANTDLTMLGESMKYVGPIAKTSGKSLEETVAALQVLSDAGLQASVGGTALRSMFSRLAQEGSDVQKVFGGLGVAIKDQNGKLRPMADIVDDFNKAVKAQGKEAEVTAMAMAAFGERAGPGFAVLLEKGGDALRNYEASLLGAGGTAKRIAETQMDNLRGSFTKLSSAAEGAMIVFGRAVAPAIRHVADTLGELMPVIGEVSAEIKPLAEAIGQALSNRIRSLTGFLAENKGEFSKWFTLLSEIFNNVTGLIGNATFAMGEFASKILGMEGGGFMNGVVAGITELLDTLSLITTDPGTFAMAMGDALVGSLKLGAASLVEALKIGITSFASAVGMTFNAAIAGLQQIFAGLLDNFPRAISAGILMGLPSMLGGDHEKGQKMSDDARKYMGSAMQAARVAARQSIAHDMAADNSPFTNMVNGLVNPVVDGLRNSAADDFASATGRGEEVAAERESRRSQAEEARRQAEKARREEERMAGARKSISPFANFIGKSLSEASSEVSKVVGQAATGAATGNLGKMVAKGADAVAEQQKKKEMKGGGDQMDTVSFMNNIQSSLFKSRNEEENTRLNRKVESNTAGILDNLKKLIDDPKLIVGTFGK